MKLSSGLRYARCARDSIAPLAAYRWRYVATGTGCHSRDLLPSKGSSTFPDMADHPSIKPDAQQLVDGLPESATWDDLAYEVYVRQAVAAGLADADVGRTVAHDEAMARIRSRIRRAS